MRKEIKTEARPTRMIKRDGPDAFGPDCAAIICSSYASRFDVYKKYENWLVMSFDDTEDENYHNAFKPEHAEMIKNFVDRLDENVRELYILTDRAVSRGPAIEAALYLYRFGRNSDLPIWRSPGNYPNTLVFRTLCKTFGIRFAGLKTLYRKRIKRSSFDSRLRGSYRITK